MFAAIRRHYCPAFFGFAALVLAILVVLHPWTVVPACMALAVAWSTRRSLVPRPR